MSAEAAAADERSVPAWVMTFADLMTLLMCFFVLLLAFSEMDVAKFKQLSGSMKDAFGVQAEIEARTLPKGTSIIAQEFSPGTPRPTPQNTVRQFTVDSNKNTLDAMSKEPRDIEAARRQAKQLREALDTEIRRGSVAVQVTGSRVTLRILERASFASGSADVRDDFQPTIRKIAGLIAADKGEIQVSGHTDDVPISTERFRSNWELSTSRAVSVAHELMQGADIDQGRFLVLGHADTKPLATNDSAENRARNRRVEIAISHGPRQRIDGDAIAAAASDAAAPTGEGQGESNELPAIINER